MGAASSPSSCLSLVASTHPSPSSPVSREIGLQAADEEEQQKNPAKKKKRRKSEVMEEKGVEYWVEERQRKRARKEEEAQKRKRTVFVGNLPISCTKKVGGDGSGSIRGSEGGAAVGAQQPLSSSRCFRICSGMRAPSSPSAFARW